MSLSSAATKCWHRIHAIHRHLWRLEADLLQRVHELTDHSQSHVPVPELVAGLNRYLRGWAHYFGYGYPRQAFRAINAHAQCRLAQHLRQHRSQRAYRPPPGVSLYAHFRRLGLISL